MTHTRALDPWTPRIPGEVMLACKTSLGPCCRSGRVLMKLSAVACCLAHRLVLQLSWFLGSSPSKKSLTGRIPGCSESLFFVCHQRASVNTAPPEATVAASERECVSFSTNKAAGPGTKTPFRWGQTSRGSAPHRNLTAELSLFPYERGLRPSQGNRNKAECAQTHSGPPR